MIKKAVILSAGFGTRFIPFCKSSNKGLLPIIDTPTIEYVVDELVESGIEKILLVVGFNKEGLKKHFSRCSVLEKKFANKKDSLYAITKQQRVQIDFVEQKKVNGTGSAVLLARNWVGKDNFVLAYSDDLMKSKTPVTKQLIDVFEKTGKMVLGCQNVPRNEVCKYSSVEYSQKVENFYYVSQVVEKPKPNEIKSTLSTLGRYILTPKIFQYCKKLSPNPKFNEILFTDTFNPIAKNDGLVACEFSGKHYDTGNKLGYLSAVIDTALESEEFGKTLKERIKSKLNESQN